MLREVVGWVMSVCHVLPASQSKTLVDLVAATMSVNRVSVAEIGRRVSSVALVKHAIKRCWRFTANHSRRQITPH